MTNLQSYYEWGLTLLTPVLVFLITTYLARWVLDREDSKQNRRLESKVRKRLKKAVERRTEELRSEQTERTWLWAVQAGG